MSLQWQMDWGDKLDWLLDIEQEDGITPRALIDRPELPDELRFAWDAWWTLTADRPMGFGGAGPIPFTAIDRFARRYAVRGPEAFEELVMLITSMDEVFLAHQRRKTKPETAKD